MSNMDIQEQNYSEENQEAGVGNESPLAREDAGQADENDENSAADETAEEKESGLESAGDEIEALRKALEQKENEMNELLDKAQRLAAEYDNYRKRTIREKEKLYDSSVCDVVAKFLPVVDNLERAVATEAKTEEGKKLLEGLGMILRLASDILDKLGVKPIEAVGRTFDPRLHNAVMHVEDENYGVGEVVEEFQKGYIYKDETVIRHSMVKVAN